MFRWLGHVQGMNVCEERLKIYMIQWFPLLALDVEVPGLFLGSTNLGKEILEIGFGLGFQDCAPSKNRCSGTHSTENSIV